MLYGDLLLVCYPEVPHGTTRSFLNYNGWKIVVT